MTLLPSACCDGLCDSAVICPTDGQGADGLSDSAVICSTDGQGAVAPGANSDSAAPVRQTAKVLSRQVLTVSMNLEQPWVLEPWHLSVAFRKAGFVVPEQCLQMPAATIEGPNVDGLEGREFVVTVTVGTYHGRAERDTGVETAPGLYFHTWYTIRP